MRPCTASICYAVVGDTRRGGQKWRGSSPGILRTEVNGIAVLRNRGLNLGNRGPRSRIREAIETVISPSFDIIRRPPPGQAERRMRRTEKTIVRPMVGLLGWCRKRSLNLFISAPQWLLSAQLSTLNLMQLPCQECRRQWRVAQ